LARTNDTGSTDGDRNDAAKCRRENLSREPAFLHIEVEKSVTRPILG
jgi:hypothetical protein